MVNIRKETGTDGKGIVYYLPDSLIQNTQAAFNTAGKTPADLDKSKPYLAPAGAEAIPVLANEAAPSELARLASKRTSSSAPRH